MPQHTEQYNNHITNDSDTHYINTKQLRTCKQYNTRATNLLQHTRIRTGPNVNNHTIHVSCNAIYLPTARTKCVKYCNILQPYDGIGWSGTRQTTNKLAKHVWAVTCQASAKQTTSVGCQHRAWGYTNKVDICPRTKHGKIRCGF